MAASINLYGAIRKLSEEPLSTWIDVSTIKFSRYDSQREVNKIDAILPKLAELHPVIRIAKLHVEEIENQ